MQELDSDYSMEVDNINKESWHDLLMKFDDASFYQTWSYGEIRWGKNKLSHIVLKKNGTIVSIAQLRIIKLPLLPAGIAYITYGPVWKPRGEKGNINHMRNILRALYNEYVKRRGFMLTILTKTIEESNNISEVFINEGFLWSPDPQHTVIVDLFQPIEVLKKNLRRGWKRSLNAAKKEQLEFIEGTDDELFEMGLKINEEMKRRKRFAEFKDMKEIMAIHKDLPDALKLHIVLCKHEGEPVSVLGWFPIGKIGLPLLGATGAKGLPLKASFPLWWKMILYYKDNGFTVCDLAGVNKQNNPGGYIFKTGLAGKNFKEMKYLGRFDACSNHLSLVLFKSVYFLRKNYRSIIIKTNKFLNLKT